MDGRISSPRKRRFVVPFSVIALLAASAAGQAQDRVELAASAATEVPANATAANPAFVPDEGIALEEAFAPYDTPIEPALPDHAVDITTIEPAAPATTSLGMGVASYYGRRFHGRRTANGERFDMNAMTAAHRTLPFGTRVRVTNPRNGRSVVVRINDRGPFVGGRTIDLSRAAATQIGMISSGHARVELERLD
ncbi:septal ring lytic transglycosylase RlpA family protein [Aurantiacibacter sp. D1-12]|uniref:septal ring lytic transglycosylase RlpA family protein n=1 Tax=Aurantiacibacter sp. D1-12 TaxID=2993658 RepID=UPI00237CC683|nr:septal ring lytic transglycosylase RlpA family protein [Aurantiacibacter sp. D1-12]MDE1468449.1 septal ring lytic transglycosylase RlpA family protein [Aurantiacibacter sp. D1-12]